MKKRIAWNKGKGKYGVYIVTRECSKCSVSFETTKYKLALGEGKFCSRACASSVTKNSFTGSMNYRAVHHWIQRELGKPSKCEECGKVAYGHGMHWANRSGKYLRDVRDWMRLCAKCHKNYDLKLQKNG